MRRHHALLYLVEFGIIGCGFAYLLSVSLPIYSQLGILGLMLVLYIIIGLYHHNMHHDIHVKVMLEYILVSALIFALFVFLNISRL